MFICFLADTPPETQAGVARISLEFSTFVLVLWPREKEQKNLGNPKETLVTQANKPNKIPNAFFQ